MQSADGESEYRFPWHSEPEARKMIRNLVVQYYRDFKKEDMRKSFCPGDRIPYASRVYDEKEMCALTDAALDFWLTSGRFCEELEAQFANWIGVKYASLVSSGSSANLIAFMALTAPELGERQIRRGDEVITVACAFPTTVSPILQYGAVPVFTDVTIPQYNIDVSQLEAARSDRTKAVMIAHTLGNPFDLKAIREFCDKYDLWLIEDNCDALGSRYTIDRETRYTGTWGDIGTSSFYPPHHMTTGEGGCVYTNHPLLHRLIQSYRDWGRDCVCPPGHDNLCGHRFDGTFGQLPPGYDHKYVYSHLGYNLKMTEMQAAIGLEQLQKLPMFIEKRKKNWSVLKNALADLSDRLILPEAAPDSDPSWFGFLLSVREESGLKRNQVTQEIEKRNIQTRLLFGGNLLRQPCFDQLRGTDAYRVAGTLECTDFIMRNAFWVGVYPGMTEEKLTYLADSIREACMKNA
ncbi:MAG: lipopolysaccharide biosynthesis protein RfbH [Clostridiales bacterium]|nr:lipopolysaccharide biosynthesis protein RfbH [Clostridiales bacterium]